MKLYKNLLLSIILVLVSEQIFANADNLQEVQKKVLRNDAPAQYNLGMMYLKGQGVSQSDAKALEWFLKAANNGHAQAKLVLAGLQ
jgi:TPR repeat protein